MRTALFLLAGLLLMAAALILSKLMSPDIPAARPWLLGLAFGAWLALTSFNLWIGVSRAGYAVREELPVFMLLFGVPVIAALLARRWIV
jgi:hypothetical protein